VRLDLRAERLQLPLQSLQTEKCSGLVLYARVESGNWASERIVLAAD
jgi:hypothetical protein